MAKHTLTTSISGPGAEAIDEAHFSAPTIDIAAGRRAFVNSVGLGLAGAAALGATLAPKPAQAQAIDDVAILNFALNLEYVEAEFYLRAARGTGLTDDLTGGTGTLGPVSGGRQVAFTNPNIRNFANEIAGDEQAHVRFLRTTLGAAAVARPALNLSESFTIAARAAGIISAQQTFDPFADDLGFLLAAFIFEDVGVTAYAGAAPLIRNKAYLVASARILSVEAYHAGEIRSTLYALGLYTQTQAISNLRNQLDGPQDDDQGIGDATNANVVPTDSNGLVAVRTPQQVLNVVYGNTATQPGLFFPAGFNGTIR